MNRHSSRIWRLRKELSHLDKRIDELNYERRTKLHILSRANRDYELERISFEEYSKVWEETLNGYSPEELISGYDSWIRSLEKRKEAVESEVSEIIRHEEIHNKALSISLSLILVFGIITGLSMFSTQIGDITGAAVTTERVTIEAYYAIQLSNDSIEFGALSHGSENNSAIENNETVGPSGYYIELSTDSNVPVQVNISGDGHLLNDSVIGIGNMSWASLNVSNLTDPKIGDETPLSLNEVLSTVGYKLWYNDTDRNKAYYRFWIDIPLGTPPGIYSNNITFEAYES